MPARHPTLRTLRERAGLTQTELAKRYGCVPSYIAQLECGYKSIRGVKSLLRLAAALGVEPAEVEPRLASRKEP